MSVAAALPLLGCGPSSGAACAADQECPQGQECLTEFKGGYCGIEGCADDRDCPADAQCVALEGRAYCFLRCVDKGQCNAQRPPEVAANCSSNIERLGETNDKACVPPSG